MPAKPRPTPVSAGRPKGSFYAHSFCRSEADELEKLPADGVQEEIAMLRVATRRGFEVFTRLLDDADDPPAAKELYEALGALGLAAMRVSTLMRTQAKLHGPGDDLTQILGQTLKELYSEWNISP